MLKILAIVVEVLEIFLVDINGGILMIILEDTRQQTGKHKLKHKYFENHGIVVKRTKLWVGDYTLPADQSICIDTKFSLQELISDICSKHHETFKRELLRAKESGIQLIILVEHGEDIKTMEDVYFYQNPRKHKVIWKTVNGKKVKTVISDKAVDGCQLYKSLCTIRDKYGVRFEFCTKEETGRRIVELLT